MIENMVTDVGIFFAKAQESLSCAEDELKKGRYDNCANRCYYACFQSAIAILILYGFKPKGQWSHTFVHSTFVGELINRRKLFPSEIRDTLGKNQGVREIADYQAEKINETKAKRILRRTQTFIQNIKNVKEEG